MEGSVQFLHLLKIGLQTVIIGEFLVFDSLEHFFYFSSESTRSNKLLLCMIDVWEVLIKYFPLTLIITFIV